MSLWTFHDADMSRKNTESREKLAEKIWAIQKIAMSRPKSCRGLILNHHEPFKKSSWTFQKAFTSLSKSRCDPSKKPTLHAVNWPVLWMSNSIMSTLGWWICDEYMSQSWCKNCICFMYSSVARPGRLKLLRGRRGKENVWFICCHRYCESQNTRGHPDRYTSRSGARRTLSNNPFRVFSIVKTEYIIYLLNITFIFTGVTAAQLRWHLSNMNVIQII